MGSQLLIVAGRERASEVFARARGLGMAVEGCGPRELNRRVRSGEAPAAILLSAADADPALALAALRRTRVGAGIPVIVFGPQDGEIADLDAVLEVGGDAFVPEPVDASSLRAALDEVLGPPSASPSRREGADSPQPQFAPPPRPLASELAYRAAESAPERTEILEADEESQRGEPAAEVGRTRPLGELHATLDRLEARLRSRDEQTPANSVPADPRDPFDELDDFGLDQVPDVEPDGEPLDAADSGSGFALDPRRPAPRQDTFTDVAVLRDEREQWAPQRTPRRSTPTARGFDEGLDRAERSGVLRPRRPPRSHVSREAPKELDSRPPDSVPAAVPASEQGRFADTPLPELLWSLHERRFSGRLRVQRDRAERELWFLEGELRFVRSRLASERLVDSLLRRGVLTRAQYETARRLAAKEPRRTGQLLVDAGFIKPRELERVVQDHLGRIVEACFGAESGQWSLHPGEVIEEDIVIARPLRRILLDGVRSRLDRATLSARLGSRVFRPRLRETEGPRLELIEALERELDLLPEEGDWLRAFDGKHGAEDLLDLYDDEVGLNALVYALSVTGDVLLLGEDAASAPARDPAAIDAERISERLRMAREADYFVLLSVGRDASRAAVRRAYAELKATFADENLEDETRLQRADDILELRTALEEARDILLDEAMRSAYLAHLDVETAEP